MNSSATWLLFTHGGLTACYGVGVYAVEVSRAGEAVLERCRVMSSTFRPFTLILKTMAQFTPITHYMHAV